MPSQGLVSTSSGPHEITLTINNSSLSQVLAQAAGPTTSSSGPPQEITLTISGQSPHVERLSPAVSSVRPDVFLHTDLCVKPGSVRVAQGWGEPCRCSPLTLRSQLLLSLPVRVCGLSRLLFV